VIHWLQHRRWNAPRVHGNSRDHDELDATKRVTLNLGGSSRRSLTGFAYRR
jgi:hypothetical protein